MNKINEKEKLLKDTSLCTMINILQMMTHMHFNFPLKSCLSFPPPTSRTKSGSVQILGRRGQNLPVFSKTLNMKNGLYEEEKKKKMTRLFQLPLNILRASQVAWLLKNLPANAGDSRHVASIPGSGRSPGVGNGNPLQYSCLRNPIDRGASWATVHRVAKSRTQLSKRTTATLAAYCPSEALASLVKYLFSFPLFFPNK